MASTVQHSILFYRYHPLTSDANHIEIYRSALERLCRSLNLCGRILVGASQTEGINGTLAGTCRDAVRAFTWALLGDETSIQQILNKDDEHENIRQAVLEFWKESKEFFALIGQEELRMQSPEDFKWSMSHDDEPLFPDLRIVVRKELIGSGCADLANISLQETATGYLTPAEWHERLTQATADDGANHDNSDTVIIDCRNTKEYEIGRFQGALDPQTTTYSQFPTWVQQNKALLSGKQVLMYCTGGIRCEKASAYIRRTVPNVGTVNHLKGGIHKYLETYGDNPESLWHGKNFIFDRRQAVSGEETQWGKDGGVDGYGDGASTGNPDTLSPSSCGNNNKNSREIVGKCVYCEAPYDEFDAKCVCAVCREPLLACTQCQVDRTEFHCRQHFHLKDCYFANLEPFSVHELKQQKQLLETYLAEIAVGRKFKQKRKTLLKQCQRLAERLQDLSADANGNNAVTTMSATKCRNCGQEECEGKCWGFFGLKRKELLESCSQKERHAKGLSASALIQLPKRQRQKEKEQPEIERLGLFQPCSAFRDVASGIRVPPCRIRELKCHTKGKWCGRSVLDVVQEEFQELAYPERLQACVRHGLLRLNGQALEASSIAQIKLKSSDVISRVMHWHEAPVVVPDDIGVQKILLPTSVLEEYEISPADAAVYVCNKPSTVPVHPAGPYFANVLTFLVEAQCDLAPQSLHPVHRTDRVTSGLTLCCTNPIVARVFHKSLSESSVRKMYIAKVRGRFPANADDLKSTNQGIRWLDEFAAIEVDAPVYTSDPANGVRVISDKGKASQSRFKLIYYDSADDASIVSCFPVTGRNHQLRLHLSWMGFPIIYDSQYGGENLQEGHATMDETSLELMKRASESGKQDAESEAIRACTICNTTEDGIKRSFTTAQLLGGGHSILLHAYRYEVTFLSKKQNKELVSVEYSVGLPCWANMIKEGTFSWLK